jgi:hypothetical protein
MLKPGFCAIRTEAAAMPRLAASRIIASASAACSLNRVRIRGLLTQGSHRGVSRARSSAIACRRVPGATALEDAGIHS